MENPATATAPAQGGASGAAKTPDLVGLAGQLAAKHGAKAGAAPAPAGAGVNPARNKGGRASADDEAAKWLAARGLVAVPANSAPGQAPAPAGPAYVVDPEFVRSCTQTLLKGVEAFRQRQVGVKVEAISGDRNLAREFAAEAAAPPGVIEVMRDCTVEICRKYDVLNAATPEALLGIAMAIWVTKDVTLWAKLNNLERAKAKAAQDAKKAGEEKKA